MSGKVEPAPTPTTHKEADTVTSFQTDTENEKYKIEQGGAGGEAAGTASNADEEEAKLRTAFNSVDKDGSGHISTQELSRAIEATGLRKSKDELKAIFMAADTNGDGQLDWEEFKCVTRAQTNCRPPHMPPLHGALLTLLIVACAPLRFGTGASCRRCRSCRHSLKGSHSARTCHISTHGVCAVCVVCVYCRPFRWMQATRLTTSKVK